MQKVSFCDIVVEDHILPLWHRLCVSLFWEHAHRTEGYRFNEACKLAMQGQLFFVFNVELQEYKLMTF